MGRIRNTVSVNVDVDVDLCDIDTDDLIDELESRNVKIDRNVTDLPTTDGILKYLNSVIGLKPWLMKLLRDKMILRENNTPYQRFIDSGYFIVKVIPLDKGLYVNVNQTFVTAKGLIWLSKTV